MLSASVTGESLERLRRGLAGGTSNPGSPTEAADQLLPPGGGRGREVLDLEEAGLDLFRGGCGGCPPADPGGQVQNEQTQDSCWLRTCEVGVLMEDFKEKLLGLASLLMDPGTWSPLFLALGFHVPSCCSSGYLGAHWNRQGVWGPHLPLRCAEG